MTPPVFALDQSASAGGNRPSQEFVRVQVKIPGVACNRLAFVSLRHALTDHRDQAAEVGRSGLHVSKSLQETPSVEAIH